MNRQWRSFLLGLGATLDGNRARHYGHPDEESGVADALVDLSHLGVARFTGPDARAFLHAQLATDVLSLGEHENRTAAWLSAKGRVLYLGVLLSTPDGCDLVLPGAEVADAIARFRMFVLRSQVRIEAGDDDLVRLGILGAGGERRLADVLGTATPAALQCAFVGPIRLCRLAGVTPRLLAIGPAPETIGLAESMSSDLRWAGESAWHRDAISAGIPSLAEQTRDRFIPQMLDLDRVGAVSLGKGCYPGQEIVARAHYLGRVKRRMFRAAFRAASAPAPLTGAYLPGSEEKIGEVVDAAPSGPGRWVALLVMNEELAGREVELGDRPPRRPITVEPATTLR